VVIRIVGYHGGEFAAEAPVPNRKLRKARALARVPKSDPDLLHGGYPLTLEQARAIAGDVPADLRYFLEAIIPHPTSPGTPATQALEVLDYLRGNTWPALRSLRAVCRRIIVAGEAAAPADLEVLATEVERRRHAARRFIGNGVAVIGKKVIWDGEAEALGVPPLRYWPPPPRRAMSGPKAKAGPKKGRAKGRGRVA